MTGTIFLGGGGDELQSGLVDKEFSRRLNKKKPLLYIPLAMPTSTHSFTDCLRWVRSVFAPFGNIRIEMVTDLSKLDGVLLESFSGVYIGGGNTFNLLNFLRKTGFDGVLKEFVLNGGLVYGGSAGAIIFGRTIETALSADVNEAKLVDLKGLDLCLDYSVWCHFKKSDEVSIKKLVAKGSKTLCTPCPKCKE